jgi:hypothetical protein
LRPLRLLLSSCHMRYVARRIKGTPSLIAMQAGDSVRGRKWGVSAYHAEKDYSKHGFLSDFGDVEKGLVYCAHLYKETHTVNRKHAYAACIHRFRP